jgi:hypothetical protein
VLKTLRPLCEPLCGHCCMTEHPQCDQLLSSRLESEVEPRFEGFYDDACGDVISPLICYAHVSSLRALQRGTRK